MGISADRPAQGGGGRSEKEVVDPLTRKQKRMQIEIDHPELTRARQCELLGLARSSLYYTAAPLGAMTISV